MMYSDPDKRRHRLAGAREVIRLAYRNISSVEYRILVEDEEVRATADLDSPSGRAWVEGMKREERNR